MTWIARPRRTGAVMRQASVLIVDDDEQIGRLLQTVLATLGLTVETLQDPRSVLDLVRLHEYDLIFLDVVMPGVSGMDLLASIRDAMPKSYVMMMTGYADKAMAIEALRLGAFDFLEKPLDLTLLQHVVKRALEAQAMARAHQQTLSELQRSLNELQAYTAHLEQLNTELIETHHAMLALARNADRALHDTEERISAHLRSLVLPLIENMRQDDRLQSYEAQLSLLVTAIEEAVAGLATHLAVIPALSAREMRIAVMIKNGMTSEEIASSLHISPETVKTHRRNIRKKLGLTGRGDQLRAYFRSLEADGTPVARS